MKIIFGVLSAVSLLVCAAVAFVYFRGTITMSEYKTILFVASASLLRIRDPLGHANRASPKT